MPHVVTCCVIAKQRILHVVDVQSEKNESINIENVAEIHILHSILLCVAEYSRNAYSQNIYHHRSIKLYIIFILDEIYLFYILFVSKSKLIILFISMHGMCTPIDKSDGSVSTKTRLVATKPSATPRAV